MSGARVSRPALTSRRALAAVLAAALAMLAAACTGGEYEATPIPGPSTAPATSGSTPSPTATTKAATCSGDDYLRSYPADAGARGGLVDTIVKRGRLIAGVSADTLLFGARNPQTGQIEGFDIDRLHAIAQDLGVTLDFKVITTAQRIPALQQPVDKGGVDIVARTMSITCDRWTQVAFSGRYYQAGQKVLVATDSKAKQLEDLSGKKVCAPSGSTSLKFLQTEYTAIKAVPAATHTGCLTLFQQGQVDAITGDDTVLAGLAAQDPYAKVVGKDGLTSEPYGLAMPLTATSLVKRVNAVLEREKADGAWEASYNHWLRDALGPAEGGPPRADLRRAG